MIPGAWVTTALTPGDWVRVRYEHEGRTETAEGVTYTDTHGNLVVGNVYPVTLRHRDGTTTHGLEVVTVRRAS